MLEMEMKDAFFWYLDSKYEKIRVIEEKVIGKSRADVVAVLPDSIIGFELKSDSDSYQRLLTQVKDYDKFFDLNYLVVGESHKKHAAEHVPEHWGIVTVSENTGVKILREAKPNKKAKMRWQLSLLWRSELLNIQLENRLHKYNNKSKYFVIKYLMEKVETEKLKRQICNELFERDYTLLPE